MSHSKSRARGSSKKYASKPADLSFKYQTVIVGWYQVELVTIVCEIKLGVQPVCCLTPKME